VRRGAAPAALLLASLAAARPAPAAELFAGYSGLRTGGDLVHGATLAAGWPKRHGSLRLLVEATGQSGLSAGEDLREMGLLAGMALAPWMERRLSPFVSVKAGAVRAQRQVQVFGIAIGPDGVCEGGCPYQTGPAAELGGGLDLRLRGRWALRLAQADYRVRRLDGVTDDDVRFSAGLVRR
jgi:hypothetical protein